jgi:hypothetical protein
MIATTLNNTGQEQMQQQCFSGMLKLFNKTLKLPIYREFHLENQLGINYKSLNDCDNTARSFIEMVRIRKKLLDCSHDEVGNANHNLGNKLHSTTIINNEEQMEALNMDNKVIKIKTIMTTKVLKSLLTVSSLSFKTSFMNTLIMNMHQHTSSGYQKD